MPEANIKLGVIGVGGRGGIARFAHDPANGVDVCAGADTASAALQDFQERYGEGTRVTRAYRELLSWSDIDAVFITTPDFCHEEQAVAALEAGKHVYLEKPMAITVAGCDRILQTAMREKRKLYLGHNMRHMPVILKMKELIDTGRIGRVLTVWVRHFISYGGEAYFKDWHAERAKSMGLLLQKGAHDIDVIHWLAGGYSTRVNAMGDAMLYAHNPNRRQPDETPQIRSHPDLWPPTAQTGLNPVIDVEDVNMMQMTLDNGVLACYQQCHFTPDAWRNYTFIGTEGRIENFGDFTGDVVVKLWNKPPMYTPEGNEQFLIPEGDHSTHGGADPNIVAEFVNYIRNDVKISTSPIAARNAVAAGYIATESLRNCGEAFDVPGVPDGVGRYFDRDVK